MGFRAKLPGSPERTRLGTSAAVAALCAVLAVAVSGEPRASAGVAAQDPDYGAAAAGCDVTEPDATSAPGVPALSETPRFISSQGLWVSFGEKSTVAAGPPGVWAPGTTSAYWRRGEIRAKILWRRDSRAWGTLRVKASRRPGHDKARTRYSNHLGPHSQAIPGGIIFPHEGCWKVTGKAGSATLRATVWVVSLAEG